jgi:hypothetical protein
MALRNGEQQSRSNDYDSSVPVGELTPLLGPFRMDKAGRLHLQGSEHPAHLKSADKAKARSANTR